MKEKFYKVVSVHRGGNSLTRKSFCSPILEHYFKEYVAVYTPLQETFPKSIACFVVNDLATARSLRCSNYYEEIWECEGERTTVNAKDLAQQSDKLYLWVDNSSVFVKSVTLTKFIE